MPKKYFFFALGVGVTLGAALALLYAPQSGEKTRKKIRRSAEDAADYLEDTADYLKSQAEKLASEAQALVSKTKSSVNDALNQAGSYASDTYKSAQKSVQNLV